AAAPVRSYMRIVFSQAMLRWGARAGAAWVAIMALAAVLAPFIANSHPILLKQDGHWSSPLLQHLTVNDVLILLAGILAAAACCCMNLRLPQRTLAWVAVMGLIIPAAWGRDMLW